ncbi:MAG: helix-turn-helix domain-containing protein [Acidobacteriaceae bacterium]
MKRPLKRSYNSTLRREAGERTRQSILDSARRMFLEKGYAATTMPGIARAAGVALDTVYATAGRKPALLRMLVELAIAGGDKAVAAEDRDYVRAIRAEPDAARKLRLYATALAPIHSRLAPLIRVLQEAAPLDPELDAMWREIAQRRAGNMRLLAENLAAAGRLQTSLSVSKAADIIWSMNSPEFYLLLVDQRGWSPQEYAQWLGDTWVKILLEP